MIGACTASLGVILDEPEETYRASGAIGSSSLGDFLKCETLFEGRHVTGRWPGERSKALDIGTGAHLYRLNGPRAYRKRVVVSPATYPEEAKYPCTDGPHRRWHNGSTWCKAWNAAHTIPGGLILDRADDRLVRTIAHAVRENPVARELLRAGHPEVTMRIASRRWKLPVQVRVDWLTTFVGMPLLVDLKTTDDVDGWVRHAAGFGYHRQEALYRYVAANALGLDYLPRFLFVVVEKEPPHRVAVYELDPDDSAAGWREVDEGMTRLAARLEGGGWRRDFGAVQVARLPKWATAERAVRA